MKRSFWLVILASFFFFVPPVSFGAAEPISTSVDQNTSPTEFTLSYGSTIWGICNFNARHGRLPSNVSVQQCTNTTLARHAIVDDRNIPVGTKVTLELLPIAEVQALRAEVLRLKTALQRRVETSTQHYGESQVLKIAPKPTTAQPVATVSTVPDQATLQTSWTINWGPLIALMVILTLVASILTLLYLSVRSSKVTVQDPSEDYYDRISGKLSEANAAHSRDASTSLEEASQSATSKITTTRPTHDAPATFVAAINPAFVESDVEPAGRSLTISYWFNDADTMVFCKLPWKQQMRYEVLPVQRECLNSLDNLEKALGVGLKKNELIQHRAKNRTTGHLFEKSLPSPEELFEKHYGKVHAAA